MPRAKEEGSKRVHLLQKSKDWLETTGAVNEVLPKKKNSCGPHSSGLLNLRDEYLTSSIKSLKVFSISLQWFFYLYLLLQQNIPALQCLARKHTVNIFKQLRAKLGKLKKEKLQGIWFKSQIKIHLQLKLWLQCKV